MRLHVVVKSIQLDEVHSQNEIFVQFFHHYHWVGEGFTFHFQSQVVSAPLH